MIRPIAPNDIPALKTIIDANKLFPSALLDDMIAAYFETEHSSEIWLTDGDEQPIAIAYCAPEYMTEGTWNLYLIAIHPNYQGQGRGTAMVRYVEHLLTARARILLVETSGSADFAQTRSFYRKCGYEEEARIREFYQAGEDKIIFRKVLQQA